MTGPAIDLVAVARARAELARIVDAHPHLTSPEAHARLAAALPALVESPMPPRLTPESAESTIVGVRMTDEMLRALDVEVARQRTVNPDLPITRSTVLRGIVRRALLSPAEAPSAPAEAVIARRPSAPPSRASAPPSRASVRPPVDVVVPASPRVPSELADVAQVPVNDSPQLSLIEEAATATATTPSLSVEEIRERVKALNKAKVRFVDMEAATGVSHSSINNFANGRGVNAKSLAALARYVEETR